MVKETEDRNFSKRAVIFRDTLLEEFRIEEDIDFFEDNAPTFSTADLFSEFQPDLFKKFLTQTPHQLVKFKILKRSLQKNVTGTTDKRLIRVKNINAIPLGVWAAHVSNHPYFSSLIFFLIIVNAVIQGVQTGLDRTKDYRTFEVLDIFDDMTLILFVVEIILKWIDNFVEFWLSGWNVFDFVVTFIGAIPRAISLILLDSGGGTLKTISSQLRLFRTLRILKMIARLSSLRLIISTVIDALQSLGFILLLLLLLTYMFGIFAINLFFLYTDSNRSDLLYQDKFSDLPHSFMSLFQMLTLDQWHAVEQDIEKVISPALTMTFFIVWVWVGAFIFRNVFVGVMVSKFDEMSNKAAKISALNQQERKNKHDLHKLHEELRHTTAPEKERLSVKAKSSKNLLGGGNSGKGGGGQVANNVANERFAVREWQGVVQDTLQGLSQNTAEYIWPRDILFGYLQRMERLQNNMKEYQDLQHLAATAIHNMYKAMPVPGGVHTVEGETGVETAKK